MPEALAPATGIGQLEKRSPLGLPEPAPLLYSISLFSEYKEFQPKILPVFAKFLEE